MDLGLKGKVALVLASSSGLGKGIATELAREGALLMLSGTNAEKLRRAQQEILDETGLKPETFAGDLLNEGDILSLVKQTEERLGPVYALVLNSGGPRPGGFDALSDSDWQQGFELCLLSYIRAIRAALPGMKAAGGGRILCNTSSSIKRVLEGLILSNTFRLGVVGLAKTLSRELGGEGILVNVIGAGQFKTERVDSLDRERAKKANMTVQEWEAVTTAGIPLGRYGATDEFGRLAAFLCSPANTYITGQSILADGGMVMAY